MTKNNSSSALNHETLLNLCDQLGIEPGFDDYQGIHHVATDEVLNRLIEALGYSANNESEAKKLIDDIPLESWRDGIPPVAVLHEHWQKAIEVCVPEQHIQESAFWEIRCEQGELFKGEFIAAELEQLGQKTVDGANVFRYRLFFENELPLGYHKLYVRFASNSELANKYCNLIVTPEQCYRPQVLNKGKRLWGYSIQLYTLRSERNWGIGDFSDLKYLVQHSAKQGASFIGLNPLHALFPVNPQHKSPYSPSSRLFLNYLYIDLLAVDDFIKSEAAQAWVADEKIQLKIQSLRDTDEVDYVAVAELKQTALKYSFEHFKAKHLGRKTQRGKKFKHFIEQEGESLLNQAAYDALFSEHTEAKGQPCVWQLWPKELQQPGTAAVADYAETCAEKVSYYQYLQWLSHEQLEAVQLAAKAAGMKIGLYRDLAVSVDAGGAEAWSEQQSYSFKASVGAPPDPLALLGQDWGLPPLNPHGLRRNAYSAFIKLVRANMHHAGALRIDHVMWLFRLWWIPSGMKANQAAYVYYPVDDLLGILALESQRNRCMVIGEDLGTVPEQLRTKLPETALHSYKVMYFEKVSEYAFKAPEHYEPQAMATVSTHDLATLAGWWNGGDLTLRDQLQLFPTEEVRDHVFEGRGNDRRALLASLMDAGLWQQDDFDNNFDAEKMAAFSKSVHTQLARSKAALMAVQVEDVLLMEQQVNVPGTTTEYPNWCRKLTQNLEDWLQSDVVADISNAIDAARKA